MFRGPLRGGMNRPVLPPMLANELRQANQLLADNQPGKAAAIFSQLAEQTAAMGRPRQSGNMHARAAHVWLDAGIQEQALLHGRKALTVFISMGMMERAIRFKSHFVQHLRERKLETVAQSFAKETDLPVESVTANPGSGQHGKLPPVCPQCGAPLRSDGVEWINSQSVECDSCGSVINTID
jgi:hypothetical protein